MSPLTKLSTAKDLFPEINFDFNSFVGFDQEEIDKSETKNIISIRRAIYSYLKLHKQKKRNANFAEVFKKINRELRKRGEAAGPSKKEKNNNKSEQIFKLVKSAPNSYSTLSEENINEKAEERSFLGRKTGIEVEIPDFFNDKIRHINNNASYPQKIQDGLASIGQNICKLINDGKKVNFVNYENKPSLKNEGLLPYFGFYDSNILEADLKDLEEIQFCSEKYDCIECEDEYIKLNLI